MKSINTLLVLASLLFSPTIFAASLGGKIVSDKKEQGSIYLECVNTDESLCAQAMLVTEINDEKKVYPQFTVPMGNGFDDYSERWGMFNEIATEASIRMPPVPEIRYLYLVNLSMKNYREGFKALEASEKSGQSFEMKSLFLQKLLEVIALPSIK
jgi:hypothetical protein